MPQTNSPLVVSLIAPTEGQPAEIRTGSLIELPTVELNAGCSIEEIEKSIGDSLSRSESDAIPIAAIIPVQISNGICLADPQIRAMAYQYLNATIRACANSDIDNIFIQVGGISPYCESHEDAWHRTIAAMTDIRFEAGFHSVRIHAVIPNEGFLLTPHDARRWLDECNSPWVAAQLNSREIFTANSFDWFSSLSHRIGSIRFTSDDIQPNDIFDGARREGFVRFLTAGRRPMLVFDDPIVFQEKWLGEICKFPSCVP